MIQKLKSVVADVIRFAAEAFADQYAKRMTKIDTVLLMRAAETSADFVEKHVETMYFRHREGVWSYALSKLPNEGMLFEFGVFKGRSINFLAKKLMSRDDVREIVGFDSYAGLIDDWHGTDLVKGEAFNVGNPPRVESNVKLCVGGIEKTLPEYLSQEDGLISFVHIDVDTYPTTKFILNACRPRMAEGCVIVFDDLIGFHNWQNGEFRALNEVFDEAEYDYIAFGRCQGVIKLKKL